MSSDKPVPENLGIKDGEPTTQGLPSDLPDDGVPIGSDARAPPISVSPSPPKHVTIDQLVEAANNFYNMSLAHEISVDSNFKMSKKEDPLERIVRETMHKAFWDIQRTHLEADPPNYEPAIGLMKEIRQLLEGLTLPHQKTLRAQISEHLDIESAEEEWRKTGCLHLEAFAEPLVNILALWCAPVRDPDVARLRDISDPIEFFSALRYQGWSSSNLLPGGLFTANAAKDASSHFLNLLEKCRQVFSLLELMHMDLANFTIQEMRPYIRQQAGQYEREKFDSVLDVQKNAGVDGLAITRSWIRGAFENLRNASPSAAPSTQLTPNNILREAYLALLTWPAQHELPETVAVDAKRIHELSHCLARTVTLASLMLVVCNAVATAAANGSLSLKLPIIDSKLASISSLKIALSRDIRGIIDAMPASEIPDLFEVLKLRIILVIDDWQKSINGECIAFKTADINEVATCCSSLSEAFKDQIAEQISSVLKGEHTVYKLMLSRALDFLRSALSARPPNPIQLPSGFAGLSTSSSWSTCQPSVSLDASVCALEKTPVVRQVEVPVDNDDDDDDESFPSCGPSYGWTKCSSENLSRVYDLALIASRLMLLVTHNRHVFGPHYAEIIYDLLKPEQGSE